MLFGTEKNVELTFEQLQQIDVHKKILANLESEVLSAQKVLAGTKLECERAIKDLAYRNDLLSEIEPKIKSKRDELQELNRMVGEINAVKEKQEEEIRTANKIMSDKEQELRERDAKLSISEQEHNKKVEEHNKKSDELSKHKEMVETAKNAFLKATETVKW